MGMVVYLFFLLVDVVVVVVTCCNFSVFLFCCCSYLPTCLSCSYLPVFPYDLIFLVTFNFFTLLLFILRTCVSGLCFVVLHLNFSPSLSLSLFFSPTPTISIPWRPSAISVFACLVCSTQLYNNFLVLFVLLRLFFCLFAISVSCLLSLVSCLYLLSLCLYFSFQRWSMCLVSYTLQQFRF